MEAKFEQYTRRTLERVDYGSNFTRLSKGEVGILSFGKKLDVALEELPFKEFHREFGYEDDIVIEQVVRLPNSLQKGDILEVRSFLSSILHLPDDAFELACCGQQLPKTCKPLDYFTVGCHPILLAKNYGFLMAR